MALKDKLKKPGLLEEEEMVLDEAEMDEESDMAEDEVEPVAELVNVEDEDLVAELENRGYMVEKAEEEVEEDMLEAPPEEEDSMEDELNEFNY